MLKGGHAFRYIAGINPECSSRREFKGRMGHLVMAINDPESISGGVEKFRLLLKSLYCFPSLFLVLYDPYKTGPDTIMV